jgi:hypothetical protein
MSYHDKDLFKKWNKDSTNPSGWTQQYDALDYQGNSNTGFNMWGSNASPGNLLDYSNLDATKQQSFIDYANKQNTLGNLGDKGKLGWNTGTFKAAGSILEGLGAVGTAWAGLQGVKLGKAELAELKNQWSKNYASQAITTNNQIANQNAWKTAQGRTDLGKLVPTYGSIG